MCVQHLFLAYMLLLFEYLAKESRFTAFWSFSCTGKLINSSEFSKCFTNVHSDIDTTRILLFSGLLLLRCSQY